MSKRSIIFIASLLFLFGCSNTTKPLVKEEIVKQKADPKDSISYNVDSINRGVAQRVPRF
ncbi:hypothetical protein Trichorick_01347 [Candidatus Trichorickettsia mobilis]|uniref:Lipoprotein n=1 Tax=Candidatus Trichorickettsia mobilis TaxID=1346319 RepID=A0ABZ0UWY4_9RICK|nr:hypothetical protein [Candidatus Trichorickettsia mobilis]WPY01434.1 hypothetical protein Trichorick_01347 [Candidatus Trichorickettsia mobilis]